MPMAQPQVLDPTPGPSSAEQSLMVRGLSSVYDPNQEAVEQIAKPPEVDPRAVMALSATPVETLDNRSGTLYSWGLSVCLRCSAYLC